MVVHVEEGDSENESSHNDTVHLTRDQRVGEDDEDENNLNDGHLGHDETLLNGSRPPQWARGHTFPFACRNLAFLLSVEKIMWQLLFVPFLLVLHDYDSGSDR